MNSGNFTFSDSEGKDIFVRVWEPEVSCARGIIQVIHGISEHSGRYAAFAEILTDAGFIVYAHDNRGHGKTSKNVDDLGYAGINGWNWIVRDVYELTGIIKEQNPGLPIIILGHSMGSFILRQYMFQYGEQPQIDGYILSGTGGAPYLMLKIASLLCRIVIKKYGRREKNKFIHELTFKDFNLKCEEKRTQFDWLSHDKNEVDKYIADPLCGQICTAGFYLDFFTGMLEIQKHSNVCKIPKDIHLYIFSGAMDPVGQYGKKVKKLLQFYNKAGMQEVSCKLYTGGRHEMLNELNRSEVIQDILNWINSRLDG